MGSFKNFLLEEEDEDLTPEELLQLINDELAEMDEDEIFAFAYALYYTFFDEEESAEDDYVDFTIEDVNDMIAALGEEYYIDVLDLLLPDEEEDGFDWDSIDLDGDEIGDEFNTNEAVSRVMKRKNFNRKKRKFFKKTKAQLRKGLAARKKANRMNRTKKKRYFRVNKKRIQNYQKSRSAAIKKGRHIKKVRRGA